MSKARIVTVIKSRKEYVGRAKRLSGSGTLFAFFMGPGKKPKINDVYTIGKKRMDKTRTGKTIGRESSRLQLLRR